MKRLNTLYILYTNGVFKKTILLIFVTLFILSSGCKKKSPNPIDQLPSETQTGVGTFACLVNGEAFTPKGNLFGGPIKTAQYQFVNGKQGFGISGSVSDGYVSKLVGISGDSITITIGTYELVTRTNGKLGGGYSYGDINTIPPMKYVTNTINRGQLVIKKFDEVNQIVSGTFWFDSVNSSGTIVQVREGRFDMKYVR